MNQVRGLPVRLALLLFAIPLIGLSVLGMIFNWPTEVRDPEIAGSLSATILFATALAAALIGAILFALNRVKTGISLLALSAIVLAVGII